ncbi:MAG: PilZ domain-containing protein [Planctomycetota bacterium]
MAPRSWCAVINPLASDRSVYAIELDPWRSRWLLEYAARRSADLSILPQTRGEDPPIIAVIVDHTVDGLLIRPQGAEVVEPETLVSVYCEATLGLDGTRFLFSTYILDARHDEDLCFEIAQPSHLYALQRRRYQRRNLRSKTPVWITPLASENRPALEATLLNISLGGLAARLDRAGADLCNTQRPVHLEFTLADSAETFRMPAHVRCKTPGASPGQVILALEFVSGPAVEAQREKLADALFRDLVVVTGG